jgi:hypothetical protein
MLPTVEQQLRAIRRLVDAAARQPGLGEDGTAALALASSQLRRLEASLPARLPFLVEDNRRSAHLLAELAGVVPALAAEAAALDGGATPEPTDEAAVHGRNLALRGLLARAVHDLGDGEAAEEGRARLARHLRDRLAADPSLNRPTRTATA